MQHPVPQQLVACSSTPTAQQGSGTCTSISARLAACRRPATPLRAADAGAGCRSPSLHLHTPPGSHTLEVLASPPARDGSSRLNLNIDFRPHQQNRGLQHGGRLPPALRGAAAAGCLLTFASKVLPLFSCMWCTQLSANPSCKRARVHALTPDCQASAAHRRTARHTTNSTLAVTHCARVCYKCVRVCAPDLNPAAPCSLLPACLALVVHGDERPPEKSPQAGSSPNPTPSSPVLTLLEPQMRKQHQACWYTPGGHIRATSKLNSSCLFEALCSSPTHLCSTKLLQAPLPQTPYRPPCCPPLPTTTPRQTLMHTLRQRCGTCTHSH